MNWIGTWCAERCSLNKRCEECIEVCEPRIAIANAVKCSEHLIWILTFQNGGVTLPHFADAIADYIGATIEQRDSIVAAQHRGTWKPNPKLKSVSRGRRGVRRDAKPVVAIDRYGYIVRRFLSMRDAARYVGCSVPTVQMRCSGTPLDKDEFTPYGISFRFESEWDNLTTEQRHENVRKRREKLESKAH